MTDPAASAPNHIAVSLPEGAAQQLYTHLTDGTVLDERAWSTVLASLHVAIRDRQIRNAL